MSCNVFRQTHCNSGQTDYTTYLPFLPSKEKRPGPAKKITKNAVKYINADSFVFKESPPCTINAATAIVIAAGKAASLVFMPKIINTGAKTSPIRHRIKEAVAPIPIGSANSIGPLSLPNFGIP